MMDNIFNVELEDQSQDHQSDNSNKSSGQADSEEDLIPPPSLTFKQSPNIMSYLNAAKSTPQQSTKTKRGQSHTSSSQKISSSPKDKVSKKLKQSASSNPPDEESELVADDTSQATPPSHNVFINHEITRVDLRIKVGPHTNPEEETKQVLNQFMQQLQKVDAHIGFAPWDELSTQEVW
eukprot:CAMPEP_0184873994 /NCGR_PEP_ID=MMETSP0580-20130426/42146_1 /TAXON_ID=1118495 /ORGANISM="Dactyliosolen fragilissimus" /LENGTH=178 /DNA_ID=CAMNT_0027376953 /DNA_START=1707 /DNA_END=2240 /DNA_ORIENTATION=+